MPGAGQSLSRKGFRSHSAIRAAAGARPTELDQHRSLNQGLSICRLAGRQDPFGKSSRWWSDYKPTHIIRMQALDEVNGETFW